MSMYELRSPLLHQLGSFLALIGPRVTAALRQTFLLLPKATLDRAGLRVWQGQLQPQCLLTKSVCSFPVASSPPAYTHSVAEAADLAQ